MAHCDPDQIPWHLFDSSKVDPVLLSLAKAAALVESNGQHYARHLRDVFCDAPDLFDAFERWGKEERQHGEALARWVVMADPSFNFETSFQRFCAGYQPPLGQGTMRGSRSGELIARCVVEIGTSSYYTAIKEAAQEPLLKEIARRIAADEYCHYKLFLNLSKKYLTQEKVNLISRIHTAMTRLIAVFAIISTDRRNLAILRRPHPKGYRLFFSCHRQVGGLC